MRTILKGAAGGAVALAVLLPASVAVAAPEPTGFDNTPQVIVGGGSDTTYIVMQEIGQLYNGSPGCSPDNGSTSATLGLCLATQPTNVNLRGDYDHDVATEAYPSGSSAGINGLLGTANETPPYDYARSSRTRGSAPAEQNLQFWGYGRDGIVISSYAGRPAGNITSTELYNIWNCTLTDWSQIAGYTGPGGPIVPWGMNPSSGTYATFRDYLRAVSGVSTFDPNAGACVRELSNGQPPFENDAKQILNDSTTDDDASFIWWGSYAEFSTLSYKRQSGVAWSVDGQAVNAGTIFANTYPILRSIFHVTRKADAEAAAGTTGGDINVNGADGGNAGAVREFTRFLCRTTNAQYSNPGTSSGLNPNNGAGYRTELNNVITRGGFTTVPAALRTAPYGCQVV